MRKKKVLIFTAAFGEGHNAAARGLRDGFLQVANGEVDVKIVDLFEIYGGAYQMARKAYLSMINQTPWIWEKIYQMIDANHSAPPGIAMAKIKSKMAETLEAEQPDIVISTYPAYSFLINALFANRDLRPFEFATVITDSITINSVWHQSPSDWYLLPNEATAKAMPAEIPREQLRVTGFPVSPRFANDEVDDRDETVAQTQRILYIINTQNAHPRQIIAELLTEPTIHLSVTVGRNEALKKEIEEETAEFQNRVTVYGWTDQLPELMRSHHLIISKAGGATVQESIAARTPMIVNQVVPGQEAGNVRLLLDHGCGTLRAETDLMVSEVKGAFANGGKMWKQWRANLRALSRPRAALEISEWLLAL